MSTPFKRPRIGYKPKDGKASPQRPVTAGDAGIDIDISSVISSIDALRYELRDARDKIYSSLDEYAIKLDDSALVDVARILKTESVPKAISFKTYRKLREYPDAAAIVSSFEEKSLSAWGNAAATVSSVIDAVNLEATRARAFLSDGCEDKNILHEISEWSGSARMFVVDAVSLATTDVNQHIAQDIEQYSGKAAEVQKATIVRAGTVSGKLKNTTSSLVGMLSETHSVYEDLVDIDVPEIGDSDGLVASVIKFGQDDLKDFKEETISDFSYRTEAFRELASEFVEKMSQLRLTQSINQSAAIRGGVLETSIDSTYIAPVDRTFESLVEKEADYYASEEDIFTTAQEVDTMIGSLLQDMATSINTGENADWHTKALHDALLIDAATLDGFSPSDFAAVLHAHDDDYSPLGHDHDSDYSDIAHAHAATYAPIAKGVTNGDSHNHNGGDGAQIDHGGLAGLSDNDHPQYVRLDGIDHYYDELTSDAALSAGWNFFPIGDISYLTVPMVTGDIIQIKAIARTTNGGGSIWIGIADGTVSAINDANILYGWTSPDSRSIAVDHKWTNSNATRYVWMGIWTASGDVLRAGTDDERYTRLSVTRIPTA